MSEALVRQALETRLNAIVGALATAWENTDYSPVSGTPYQRVALMRAEPDSPEMGGGLRRLQGLMQVTLFYPQGTGAGAADAKAAAVAAWFPKGLSLSSGGVVTTVDGEPYVMPGFQDGDRWAVPVRVPYFSNIS